MTKLPQDTLSDVVTNHIRRDFTKLHGKLTVGEALARIREKPSEGRFIYFYVVDDDGRLTGVLPALRLLLSLPETPVADIMVRQVVAIPAEAAVLDACEFFMLHRLLAFPVVDATRRLLGVVDVELYTKELSDLDRREGNQELFQLVGVHLTEVAQGNPLTAFRQRFPWLLANIGAGLLAAGLSFVYQRELAWRDAVLAMFIPVVLSLAESVSIQSVSLALATLRGQRPTWGTLAAKAGQEFLTGGLLGAGCGLLVGPVVLLWLRERSVVQCLLGGIVGGVASAAVLGLAMPYLLRILRRDPQVAAGPIALAADVTSDIKARPR